MSRILRYFPEEVLSEGLLDLTREEDNVRLEEKAYLAVAANQAKSTFLANMSHKLHTPRHCILNFASFGLKKPPLPPQTSSSTTLSKSTPVAASSLPCSMTCSIWPNWSLARWPLTFSPPTSTPCLPRSPMSFTPGSPNASSRLSATPFPSQRRSGSIAPKCSRPYVICWATS